MMDLGFEDFDDLNLEKDFRKKVKTQEELDKLTVDENLSEIDKAVYIVTKGQNIQCVSVINNLAVLLKSWSDTCIKKIVPRLNEILNTSPDVDLHSVASKSYCNLAQTETPTVFNKYFMKFVIKHIEHNDNSISELWLDNFIEVMPRIQHEVVTKQVIPLFLEMGKFSKPTSSRLQCCKLVAAVASVVPSDNIKQDVLPQMMLLCQDIEQEVRTQMCKFLHPIAKSLGPIDTRQLILSEIMELLSDEEPLVRISAINAFLEITHLLDKDSIVKVKPLIHIYITRAIQVEDCTLPALAKSYGRICASVVDILTSEEKQELVTIFSQMCLLGRKQIHKNMTKIERMKKVEQRLAEMRLGEAKVAKPGRSAHSTFQIMCVNRQDLQKDDLLECRRNCCYNLPAIFQVFHMIHLSTIIDCSLVLLSDDDVIVRKRVAAGLHEIAAILGKKSHLLKPHLDTMLRQYECIDVVSALLENLDKLLLLICIKGKLSDNVQGGIPDIQQALITLHARLDGLSGNKWSLAWRCQMKFVESIKCLHQIFTSDYVYYKFMTPLLNMCKTNPYLPVKKACCDTICVLLRYNKRTDHKKEVYDFVIQDMLKSPSYRHRLLFIEFAWSYLSVFSRKAFKHNIYNHIISLFDDKCVNVRLCLCELLPSMKSILQLPADRHLHSQLEQGVRKFLSMETDKDVSRAIRNTIMLLDRIQNKRTQSKVNISEEDRENERREKEEEQLLKLDEDGRKLEKQSSSVASMRMNKESNGYKLKKRNSATGTTSKGLNQGNLLDAKDRRSINKRLPSKELLQKEFTLNSPRTSTSNSAKSKSNTKDRNKK